MNIRNKRKVTLIAENCILADNFWTRFKGLIGSDSIPERSGLIITPCNSIHMFFMKFDIDVIFVDKNNKVVHIIENIKPWRISKIVFSAIMAIELPPNSIKCSRTEIGDVLEFLK